MSTSSLGTWGKNYLSFHGNARKRHEGWNIVLAIQEHLEFEHFPCQPILVANVNIFSAPYFDMNFVDSLMVFSIEVDESLL